MTGCIIPNEPFLQIPPLLVERFGWDASWLLVHFAFRQNVSDDGWVSASIPALCAEYPFLKPRTVRRAIAKCRASGVLLVRKGKAYDRSNYVFLVRQHELLQPKKAAWVAAVENKASVVDNPKSRSGHLGQHRRGLTGPIGAAPVARSLIQESKNQNNPEAQKRFLGKPEAEPEVIVSPEVKAERMKALRAMLGDAVKPIPKG